MFINGCKVFGLKEGDVMGVNDLYKADYLPAFVFTLYNLGRLVNSLPGYSGATVCLIAGPRIAIGQKTFKAETGAQDKENVRKQQARFSQPPAQPAMTRRSAPESDMKQPLLQRPEEVAKRKGCCACTIL